jgi:hypothetical protein
MLATNTNRQTPKSFVQKAWKMGVEVLSALVVTTASLKPPKEAVDAFNAGAQQITAPFGVLMRLAQQRVNISFRSAVLPIWRSPHICQWVHEPSVSRARLLV